MRLNLESLFGSYNKKSVQGNNKRGGGSESRSRVSVSGTAAERRAMTLAELVQ